MNRKISIIAIVILTLITSVTMTYGEAFIFDYSGQDLKTGYRTIDGMLEFYEGKLIDTKDLNGQSDIVPQIVDFPKGISEKLRQVDGHSDFNGTLRFVLKLDRELLDEYVTLAVRLPSDDVTIFINGNRIYDSVGERMLQSDGRYVRQHHAVFKVDDVTNDCIIHFKGMDRRFSSLMGIHVGNYGSIERGMNQQFLTELIYYFAVVMLMLLTLIVTMFRVGRKFAWKTVMPATIIFMMVLLKTLPIESDMMFWYIAELYPDLMFRLKNAGLILSLPIMVILLDLLDDRLIEPRILGFMWPLFWLNNAIILLANSGQLGWIALISICTELILMVYFTIRIGTAAEEVKDKNVFILLVSDVVIQSSFLLGFIHIQLDGRYIYLLLAIQLFVTIRSLFSKMSIAMERAKEAIDGHAGMTEDVLVVQEDHREPILSNEPEVSIGKQSSNVFPWERVIDASRSMVLIADHKGIIRFATDDMKSLFIEYEKVIGLYASELLFGDHGDGARYLNKIIIKMNQLVNLNELDPYISLLPDQLKISGKVFKTLCVPVRLDDGTANLVISVTDVTEWKHLESALKELEAARDMIRRVFPEQIIFRRVVDDFLRFVRIEIKDDEGIQTQWKTGHIIFRLRIFKGLFSYFKMMESARMIQNVIMELSESAGSERSMVGIGMLDESIVMKDLDRIRQFLGHAFDDFGRYITLHKDDLMEVAKQWNVDASAVDSMDRSIGVVEKLGRKRISTLQSFIELFIQAQGVQYGRRLKRVDVQLQDIRVGEKQYHDICYTLVNGIINAFDHGGDRMEGLSVSIDKVQDLSGGWIRIRIIDDGEGIDEGDLRSRIYSEKVKSFQDIMDMSIEEVMDHLFQPGFSLKHNGDQFVRGFGLSTIRTIASGYGGGSSAFVPETGGFELRVQLPYGETFDFSGRQREVVLKSVGQSVVNLLDYVGMKNHATVKMEMISSGDLMFKVKEFTSIQGLYGSKEVQFILTANTDFIDIVSRVYGAVNHENRSEALQDVANEILNMVIGGAMLLQMEPLEDSRIGMPINLAVEGRIRVKGDEVHMLQFEEGPFEMALLVAFN